MKNLFLTLLLINLLTLVWQLWVAPQPIDPEPAAPPPPALQLFAETGTPPTKAAPAAGASLSGPATAAPDSGITTGCVRVGPFEAATGASELASSLADRGLTALPLVLDGQIWMGNAVQVAGFSSAAAAESARQRLIAGGIPDALLMSDGPEPVISLGVFREREGTERVMAAARQLGFSPTRTDRYRPGTEHWVLVRTAPELPISAGSLRLPGAQILRAEPFGCEALDPPDNANANANEVAADAAPSVAGPTE